MFSFSRCRDLIRLCVNVKGRVVRKALGRVRQSQMEACGLDVDLAAAGLDFSQWFARWRGETRLAIQYAIPHAAALAERCPDAAQAALRAADLAMAHRFDLLGSGIYEPVDPDRPVTADGYRPIDWCLDPVRKLRFPRNIPHREWRLYEMRPENADIKYPWELARSQHFPALGQAWLLTGKPEYALEMTRQLEDFVEANPVGLGINWTCAMDVAIRAANWAMGLALIVDCPAVDEARWKRLWTALFDHGRFVFGNFENTYEVTSNHYLSNVVGLFFVASVFSDLNCGRRWDEFCRASLECEIGVQVLPDGADFESSLPYHRLVTELFLSSARLAQIQGRPLSGNYHQRLRRMMTLLLGTLRPDGVIPQIGDADDGRLHIFTRPADWARGDGRHLLAPAALVLQEPSWLAYAGDDGLWEATWWGYDPAAIRVAAEPPPPTLQLFPDSGLFVVRRNGCYLLVSNGRVGTKGIGNHKHNDLLSFEYGTRRGLLVLDPGSYVYTSDFDTRNHFRSVACHNTLRIDGEEQNELRPDMLFRMFEKADPVHLEHGEEPDGAVFYVGAHTGYGRLPGPVTHRRRFRLETHSEILTLTDELQGTGTHRIDWHFHLAPGVVPQTESSGVLLLAAREGGAALARLFYPSELEAVLGEGWYSPSYAAREPTHVIDMTLTTSLDAQAAATWRFRFVPCDKGRA